MRLTKKNDRYYDVYDAILVGLRNNMNNLANQTWFLKFLAKTVYNVDTFAAEFAEHAATLLQKPAVLDVIADGAVKALQKDGIDAKVKKQKYKPIKGWNEDHRLFIQLKLGWWS